MQESVLADGDANQDRELGSESRDMVDEAVRREGDSVRQKERHVLLEAKLYVCSASVRQKPRNSRQCRGRA